MAGAGALTRSGICAGKVSRYDPDRGLGTVVDEAGVAFAFHTTAIADGSRLIEAGTVVVFTLVPGHLGRVEARNLHPVASLP